MQDLLPSVCHFFLSKHDPVHSARFVKFLQLLASGEFHVDNICWLIFSDLLQRLSV